MFSLSQSSGYVINALVCLAERGGDSLLVRDLAEKARVPKAYLAKLIPKLTSGGILQAKRGFGGGVKLARDPAKISIVEVVRTIDGPGATSRCLLGIPGCSDEHACPIHEFWKEAQTKAPFRELTLKAILDYKHKVN